MQVGHFDEAYSSRLQKLLDLPQCCIGIGEMFQHVPERDHIELFTRGRQLLQWTHPGSHAKLLACIRDCFFRDVNSVSLKTMVVGYLEKLSASASDIEH